MFQGREVDLEECWLYAGYISEQGYGHLWHKGKKYIVHRLSYETFVGPIPDGLVIDHLCRVRCCMNPDHLDPVTVRINSMRGLGAEINRLKTHCPTGHEYTEENTQYFGKNPGRRCRQCALVRKKLDYQRIKASYA